MAIASFPTHTRPGVMDHHHHIIATDLLTHWAESTGSATMEQQQQPGDEQHNKAALVQPQISSLHGGAGPTAEELLVKQKSRRSLTEAERGLTAEPNALRPPTTKAGKHRIRMKWSTETNEFIMRTYYTITSNETVSNLPEQVPWNPLNLSFSLLAANKILP